MAFQESYRDLMYGDWMADESRSAARCAGPCVDGHRYHPDGRGGGVCPCGDVIDRSEVQ